MTEEKLQVTVGALLHDVGKVIYSPENGVKNHSVIGADFLENEGIVSNKGIIDCVRYHHSSALKTDGIANDSPAYIVYQANNIASDTDRSEIESEDCKFEMSAPLESVFNILNGNNEKKYYAPKTLSESKEINYPSDDKKYFDERFYLNVKEKLCKNLKGFSLNSNNIGILLEILEDEFSYMPASISNSERMNVSLYDHLKMTAALSGCILDYLKDQNITDYKKVLWEENEKFYDTKAFLLYSMDVSGIQEFIYTITTENALKTLRARSFYIEMLMEHIIDELLDKLELSRTNLIYSGGGHCYILVANTDNTKKIISDYNKQINEWLIDKFNISLYVADGFCECSANMLKNVPKDSYSDIFIEIGSMSSSKKAHKYDAENIIKLNNKKASDYSRECKICKRLGETNNNGICEICDAIQNFSKNILYDEFFSVVKDVRKDGLPLPGGYSVFSDDEKSLTERMNYDDGYVRTYSKNKIYSGKNVSTKLWVGNYTSGNTFEEMAQKAEGIERIAVLRADVDNLGHTFVCGFNNRENNDKYATLARTATLSRQLSLFFKNHINSILSESEFSLNNEKKKRNATICYSGGDDLFIVGSWNDVIELAVDISEAFHKYTQGTLTISGGIGIYSPSYPISRIALEVGDMEDVSKKLPGKNAITVFPDGVCHMEGGVRVSDGTYKWSEFTQEVIAEKYRIISRYFDNSSERGKNFLYNLLELIRNQNEKINFARYVYLLSRLEPSASASKEEKDNYKEFSKHMYEWIKDEKSVRQLKTAINLYAYLTRENKED